MGNIPIVTIDGPAGSGKGTISLRVAQELGWRILDSGALYRLVALAAQRKGVEFSEDDLNIEELTKVAENLDVTFHPKTDGSVQILLDGIDVTEAIRAEECGCNASLVATINPVRIALLTRQRKFLENPGLIADGRDMGTVVFPDAGVKIFLTASAEIRGKRRLNQLKERGINANLAGLISDIEKRDARDVNRKDAPLVPANDAIIIDSGKLTIDEVVTIVMQHIQQVY